MYSYPFSVMHIYIYSYIFIVCNMTHRISRCSTHRARFCSVCPEALRDGFVAVLQRLSLKKNDAPSVAGSVIRRFPTSRWVGQHEKWACHRGRKRGESVEVCFVLCINIYIYIYILLYIYIIYIYIFVFLKGES